ncbi:MAG: hypothetical protein HC825_07795 [Oscillatoriales cyanobacterium RM1_1_9]|nr:hypothetical protein [Oscillatoriales cyanobacterium SM2_3_0]NJO47515.1 hypothetical protein [Oscillatoriales cyanobacterium RM2_1_1]NJO71608.1 hypothetical protein [Oscillatoriales cyanobacterium RM1_1_9]
MVNKIALIPLSGLLIASPIILNRKVVLNCERLERNYVVCSKENRYIYGKISQKTDEFKLANTILESNLHLDEDGDYYTYEVFILSSQNERMLFYNYGRNKSQAQRDEAALKNLLANNSLANSGDALTVNRSYLFRDLYLIFWPGYMLFSLFARSWKY